MSVMLEKRDISKGPGILIPPPVYYTLVFIAGLVIQKMIPIVNPVLRSNLLTITGIVLLILAGSVGALALWQFLKTGNTVILHKRAKSLQTTGIYSITRNPMYVGLSLAYLAVTFLAGNWWHIMLLPFLILFVHRFIILREEDYLKREFGIHYEEYCKQVRRWL